MKLYGTKMLNPEIGVNFKSNSQENRHILGSQKNPLLYTRFESLKIIQHTRFSFGVPEIKIKHEKMPQQFWKTQNNISFFLNKKTHFSQLEKD